LSRFALRYLLAASVGLISRAGELDVKRSEKFQASDVPGLIRGFDFQENIYKSDT
jgi:hypothetical protein